MADIGDIPWDVFKALTNLRETETTTYSEVLRKLLNLPPNPNPGSSGVTSSGNGARAWLYRGVTFPDGTEFRANYKGKTYTARVEGDTLRYEGEDFGSPSELAHKITGTSTNGWRFWECRKPGESRWRLIDALR